MMKNAIILHGRPSKDIYYSSDFPSSSNFAWIPWLQKQLMIKGVKADTPEVPCAYTADYDVWRKEFERFDVNDDTMLIGHSAGAGFLVRWLSENKKVRVGKVILVALGLSLIEDKMELIDPNLEGRTQGLIAFVSDNDPANSLKNTTMLNEKVENMKIIELKGYGHFIPEHMKKNEFQEILEEL